MDRWEQERKKKLNEYLFIAHTVLILMIVIALIHHHHISKLEKGPYELFIWAGVVCIGAGIAIFAVWYYRFRRTEYRRMRTNLFDLIIVLVEMLIVVYVVHITGSYKSNFKVLYLLPPIISSIRYGRRGGVLVGGLSFGFMLADHIIVNHQMDALQDVLDFQLAYGCVVLLTSWLIGSMTDIEKQLREKMLEWNQYLQRTERLSVIGQMAAGTAHEIRNPLTTIRGFLQLLQLRIVKDENPQYGEYLDIVLKEIDRMNHIVSDFLLLAKPKEEDFITLEINDLLQEIISLVNSESLLRGIEVRLDFASQLPSICGDQERLKQVFLNLIHNAFQAMDGHGILILRTCYCEESTTVMVTVGDTGCGISKENLDKLFDPFFTTKDSGTGLGLAISNQIISSHNGCIKVESELGQGTAFHIYLPAIIGT